MSLSKLNTLISSAVSEGQYDNVNKYIEEGLDINTKYDNGLTMIHLAAEKGQTEIIRLLDKLGANIEDTPDNYDWMPIHAAAQFGQSEAVRVLNQLGANIEKYASIYNPVLLAAKHNNTQVVRTLHQLGADLNVNTKIDKNDNDDNGFTAAHHAVKNNNIELLRVLVELGVNINVMNIVEDYGQTPIQLAINQKNIKILKLLFEEYNIDINIQNNFKKTPIRTAADCGHLEILRLLRDLGANINIPDNKETTPVNAAAYEGNIDVVRFLVWLGANINTPNNDGITPIHAAASKGYVDIVRLLEEYGANINIPNNDGITPINTAALKGYVEVVKLLEEKGANINISNNDDQSNYSIEEPKKPHPDNIPDLDEYPDFDPSPPLDPKSCKWPYNHKIDYHHCTGHFSCLSTAYMGDYLNLIDTTLTEQKYLAAATQKDEEEEYLANGYDTDDFERMHPENMKRWNSIPMWFSNIDNYPRTMKEGPPPRPPQKGYSIALKDGTPIDELTPEEKEEYKGRVRRVASIMGDHGKDSLVETDNDSQDLYNDQMMVDYLKESLQDVNLKYVKSLQREVFHPEVKDFFKDMKKRKTREQTRYTCIMSINT